MSGGYLLLDSPWGQPSFPALASKDVAAHYVVNILGHPQFLAGLYVTAEVYYGFSEDTVLRLVRSSSQVVGYGCTMDAPLPSLWKTLAVDWLSRRAPGGLSGRSVANARQSLPHPSS